MAITIDFYGPGGQLHHSITQKQNGESFSPSYSFDHCRQYPLSFMSFGQVDTATLLVQRKDCLINKMSSNMNALPNSLNVF